MSTKTNWVSWHLTSTTLNDNADYYVEAKPGKRWHQVGGPFADRDSANDYAREYSKSHPNVEVRVVVYQ